MKKVLIIGVIIAVVLGGILYLQSNSEPTVVGPTELGNSIDGPTDQGGMDQVDHSGTHIMPDGTVMLGNGEPLSDATILPDGMIQLGNGSIIEPAFDLR